MVFYLQAKLAHMYLCVLAKLRLNVYKKSLLWLSEYARKVRMKTIIDYCFGAFFIFKETLSHSPNPLFIFYIVPPIYHLIYKCINIINMIWDIIE